MFFVSVFKIFTGSNRPSLMTLLQNQGSTSKVLLRCCHGSVNSVDRIFYGVKVEFVVQQWHGLDSLNVQHFDKLCVLLGFF